MDETTSSYKIRIGPRGSSSPTDDGLKHMEDEDDEEEEEEVGEAQDLTVQQPMDEDKGKGLFDDDQSID